MCLKTLAMGLMLVGTLVPQLCCQHWSYGLRPGGKRGLDALSQTLGSLVEEFPRVEPSCSVQPGGTEESPEVALMNKMRGFLGSATNRGNGHRTDRK